MSEDMKHQKPRGSIELKKAVISPSEEDSTTFTIHSFENELFKLRAQDAKERQHWVNVLRFVVQSQWGDCETVLHSLSSQNGLNGGSLNTSSSNINNESSNECNETSIGQLKTIPNEKYFKNALFILLIQLVII